MLKFVQADACETLNRSAGMADLVFMDPPFNIGVNYANCNDKIPDSDFLIQLQNWIDCSINAMKTHGSIWLHLPDRWTPDALVYARQRGLTLENWIIWHYRFGVCQPNRFINSKCHGLWFSFGEPKVNVQAGHVASDRAALYNDWRSDGTRMDLDVWGFEKFWGRVQGNNKERRPLHPNQLPEKYLERIIKLTTIAGDLVVDPFCGSGTTAAVADALGRHCITGDLSQEYLDSAKERTAVRVNYQGLQSGRISCSDKGVME